MDYTLLVLCLCASAVLGENDVTECTANEYFKKETGECLPCTLCRASNTIIRVPCSKFADTVCGPFLEFDRFHQAPIINLLPADNDTTKVLVTGPISGGSFESTKSQGSVPVERVTDERWYTLAMALVGVLSVVSVIIIVYITIYCFVCRKHREEKELIYYPELCASAPETPRVLTPRMTSRDRLKKHMITSYREETGDTYGATSNQVVVLANGFEPCLASCEASTDSDENSGQTISSSSTNYVYFKAPPCANV